MINGSFENYDTCPYLMGQLGFATNIYNPNQNTPDYLNVCSTNSQITIPTNFWGNQDAKSGMAYAAFGMNLNGSDIKEYITLEFYDSLISGKKYLIQFYVSMVDNAKFSIHQIGAYLHDFFINQTNPYFINVQPHIENSVGNYITDKINWVLIEGTFIAGGGILLLLVIFIQIV